jgi:hypothetical protein
VNWRTVAHFREKRALPIDSRDDAGRGNARDVSDDCDSSTAGQYDFAARDLFRPICASFGQDVRLESGDDVDRGVGIEEDDMVDAGECGKQSGATLFVDDRAARAFQAADAGVAVDGHDQHVAETGGFCEAGDVTDVEEVEATVGENDRFPGIPIGLHKRQKPGERGEFR